MYTYCSTLWLLTFCRTLWKHSCIKPCLSNAQKWLWLLTVCSVCLISAKNMSHIGPTLATNLSRWSHLSNKSFRVVTYWSHISHASPFPPLKKNISGCFRQKIFSEKKLIIVLGSYVHSLYRSSPPQNVSHLHSMKLVHNNRHTYIAAHCGRTHSAGHCGNINVSAQCRHTQNVCVCS